MNDKTIAATGGCGTTRQQPLPLPDELIVDNFAGGGGASIGIELGIGRPVDIAINHDAEAVAMHRANHPETKHYVEDVWKVDPVKVTRNQPVGLAWFSPDCKQLVTVSIGEQDHVLTDIGMRMLQPHELYAAQGFPPGYIHDQGRDADGNPITLTKTAQVCMCGNSVCPPLATALVRANFEHELAWKEEQAA